MTCKKDFIREHCALLPGPIAREIQLYQASVDKPLWQAGEKELAGLGVEEPYWAFAWAGGQALARYILDNPSLVEGRRVLSFACGGGGEAIAAKRAGAAQVLAADTDPFAIAACELNAAANGVTLELSGIDMIGQMLSEIDLLLLGDVFYDRQLASRVEQWIDDLSAMPVDILIGDPGRTYLPRQKLQSLASYRIDYTNAVEDSDLRATTVWGLADC